MTRIALIAMSLGIVGLIGASALSGDEALAGKACSRTTFKTELIKGACQKGGQAAAKTAMQNFLKTAKKTESGLECKGCHKSLGPDYPTKDDAVDHFHRL